MVGVAKSQRRIGHQKKARKEHTRIWAEAVGGDESLVKVVHASGQEACTHNQQDTNDRDHIDVALPARLHL